MSWGVAGWLFVPAPWQAENVLTLLMTLAAAVLANIGASLPIYVVFIAGALLPTAVYRGLLGGAINLGLSLGALMMLALTVFASRLAAATRRSLRIGHENRRLARALEQRTREAEQANLDKSRFIAASHDLRQPVHALGLLLDVLQGQSLSPQAQGTAPRMAHVLDSPDSLFGGLLDVSRLDSGAIEPRRADFALRPLLLALTDEFKSEGLAKGLSLRCRVGDVWIRSDPLLLERILRNLLANAVRDTIRGGIVVACRRRGAMLRIEVWDSGIGIADAQHGAVLNEFYPIANRQRDADQGLGLGLAIVRRLGALLGHPIELRSRLGRGSVFRVSVPLATVPEQLPDADPAVDAQAALPPSWPERRVLVVEDDARARDALVSCLATWGCQVVACASAAAVRVALETIPAAPDVLVTDWRLPGGEDGLDVVRLVHQRFCAALPAILIAGDALDDARRLAREYGVVLLHKPVRPAALRAALGAHWLPVLVAETAAAPSPPRDGAPRLQEGAS